MEAALMIILFIIYLAVFIFMFAAMWKVFQKAGQPGWAAIVPIYNILTIFKIINKPWWWLIMLCIPGVNVIFLIWTYNLLAKSFGKTEGFTVGLLLLGIVFLPMLAWGDATYQGPAGK